MVSRMQREKSVKLSIVVAVYNHEKYVKQAINSILEQEVNFEYEVLIGEDCSTDKSREVLQEIEKNCPSNFHFFYRETNYGAERNFRDLLSRMRGEYFIILEGDDYWSYPLKLQKQVDYLETHPEYIECSHLVKVVDENSKIIDIEYPCCKDEEYSLSHFRRGILPGHTSCNLYRNFYKKPLIETSLLNVPFPAGDRQKAFTIACQGKIHCIQEYWSNYRYITNGGDSFSANNNWSIMKLFEVQNFYMEMINFARKLGNKEGVLAAEELYYQALASEIVHTKKIKSVIKFICKFCMCHNKLSVTRILVLKKR